MEQEKELYITYRNVIQTIVKRNKNRDWKLELRNLFCKYDELVEGIPANSAICEEMKEELKNIAKYYGYIYCDEDGNYINPSLLEIHIINTIREGDQYSYERAKKLLSKLSYSEENIMYEDVKNNIESYFLKVDFGYPKIDKNLLDIMNKTMLAGFELMDQIMTEVILHKKLSDILRYGESKWLPDEANLTIKDVLRVMF